MRSPGDGLPGAAAVVYFAGDESASTTGQLIEVAGGFGLAMPVCADAMVQVVSC